MSALLYTYAVSLLLVALHGLAARRDEAGDLSCREGALLVVLSPLVAVWVVCQAVVYILDTVVEYVFQTLGDGG